MAHIDTGIAISLRPSEDSILDQRKYLGGWVSRVMYMTKPVHEHRGARLPAQMDVPWCLPLLGWKLSCMQTYIHMQCTHTHMCMDVLYTYMCVCKLAHICKCMCIAWLSFWTWQLTLYVLVEMFGCLLISHPVFWELLLAKRKAENKVTGAQQERMQEAPEASSPPIPFLQRVARVDSEGKMVCTPSSSIPYVSESHLAPLLKQVLQRVRQSPQRTERWRKGLGGAKWQFAGMPRRESNSKQNILLINKKLSPNNVASSPLTPLDLRFASASSQSRGIWTISPPLSQAPLENLSRHL